MGLLSRFVEKPLVASVRRHEGRNVEFGATRRSAWQARAWNYWGMLGELHYPTSQLARHVTRMGWNITVDGYTLDSNSELGETPETDLFFEAVAGGVGKHEAIRNLALSLQVAGECWYVQREGSWKVLSVVDPKLNEALYDSDAIRLQAKTSDPRDSRFAESAFMAVLGPAEELLTLEALSRSQTRARISQAGILFRPKEVTFDDDDDPFGKELEEAMTAPIADEHHPASLTPLDIEVPADMIEKFRHMVFSRPYDEHLHERIERATRRIAIALDIPPELLTGVADLNHWTAWLTQEDTNRSHVEPLAARVGEVFEVAGEVLEIGSNITVVPDASELLARRSTVRDAMDSARLGAVGLAYVREAIGATDDDKPTAEDLRLLFPELDGEAVSMPAQTSNGDAPEVLRDPPDVEDGPAGDEPAPAEGGGPQPVTGGMPMLTAAVEAEPEVENMANQLAAFDQELRDTLFGALSMAEVTARRKLGAKVRTAVRGTTEHDLIDDVDNTDVVATLTLTRARELVDVDGTLRDAFADLAGMWRRMLARARRRLERITGIPMDDPEWFAAEDRSVEFLVEGMVEWSVDQIDNTEAQMLEAPQDLAREVVARAGGS